MNVGNDYENMGDEENLNEEYGEFGDEYGEYMADGEMEGAYDETTQDGDEDYHPASKRGRPNNFRYNLSSEYFISFSVMIFRY